MSKAKKLIQQIEDVLDHPPHGKHRELYTTEKTLEKSKTSIVLKQDSLYSLLDLVSQCKNSAFKDEFNAVIASLEEDLESETIKLLRVTHQVLIQKGIVFYNKGILDEALDCWEMVLKRDPGNTIIHSLLDSLLKNLE